jgi:DNA-binding transcriptional LysR family regulator
LNIRLLKAFLILAEKGNYADAARALFISQPALTKQINLLESQVNMSLFSRGRHGAILTASAGVCCQRLKKWSGKPSHLCSMLSGYQKEWRGISPLGSVSQAFIWHHAVSLTFVGTIRE